MKSVKVSMTVPQKAIDDAVKERIKELERENKDLRDRLQRITAEVSALGLEK